MALYSLGLKFGTQGRRAAGKWALNITTGAIANTYEAVHPPQAFLQARTPVAADELTSPLASCIFRSILAIPEAGQSANVHARARRADARRARIAAMRRMYPRQPIYPRVHGDTTRAS